MQTRTKSFVLFAALALLSSRTWAQEPPKVPAPIVRIDAPRDAVRSALSHALSVKQSRPEDLVDLQYFWIVYPSDRVALNFTVNATSRSPFIIRAEDAGYVAAIDLANYYPDPKDRAEIRRLLNSVFDPFFHVIRRDKARVKVKVPPYVAQDGKTYDWKWSDSYQDTKSFGLHVQGHDPAKDAPPEPADINLLADLLHSDTPILTAPFYVSRKALVELDGGLYYDLLGWQGKSHDEVLALFGASQKRAEEAKADERAALFFSEVTGDKPRACVFFYGSHVRTSAGIPLITITEDIRDGDFDPKKSSVHNLLGAKFDAGEAFGILPNGIQAGWLFDKNTGNLVASAPDDIAVDHTIPAPYTKRLQPYISCVSCHSQETGYRSFPNHVRTLLGQGQVQNDLLFFQSAGSGGEDLDELRLRLRGLYSGDLSKVLEQARRDQAFVAFQATGVKYEETMKAVLETYHSYEYTRVHPTEVCRYLGYKVDSNEVAVKLLKKLLPPLPGIGVGGFIPENPSVMAIKAGIPLPRREFEFIYPDLALRAQANAQ